VEAADPLWGREVRVLPRHGVGRGVIRFCLLTLMKKLGQGRETGFCGYQMVIRKGTATGGEKRCTGGKLVGCGGER